MWQYLEEERVYREDCGSKFLQNLAPICRTVRRHIPEDRNLKDDNIIKNKNRKVGRKIPKNE
jgi:hypothetical protein